MSDPDRNTTKRLAKRTLDLAIALPMLLFLSPLMAAIAVAILLRDGWPLLFRQTRVGLHDREFTIYKFRTMTADRDPAGALLPDGARLTALGKKLRDYSLDELPQIWNVVRGDMSLVGPRPLLPQYLPRYTARQRRRHIVKPGITGWAQVNGRNCIDWEQKFDLDIWYVDHRSLILDLKILWSTAMRVIRREGIAQQGHATMPEFMGTSRKTESV